jgi:hypothetical protein
MDIGNTLGSGLEISFAADLISNSVLYICKATIDLSAKPTRLSVRIIQKGDRT